MAVVVVGVVRERERVREEKNEWEFATLTSPWLLHLHNEFPVFLLHFDMHAYLRFVSAVKR